MLAGPEDGFQRREDEDGSSYDEDQGSQTSNEPELVCGNLLDSLFDDKFRAPTIIHSDDLCHYDDLKTPVFVESLGLDRWAGQQFTAYLFNPSTSQELINTRQNFFKNLLDLPNIDAIWKEFLGATQVVRGLGRCLALIDSPIEESNLYVLRNYREDSERYQTSKKAVEDGCAKVVKGRASLERLVTLLPQDNPLLKPLVEGFSKFSEVFRNFDSAAVLDGTIGEVQLEKMIAQGSLLISRCTFLIGMTQLIKKFGMHAGTCDSTKPEQHEGGWNPFYLETRDHRNPSTAEVPVIALAGPNNSGKSVSGVHQNVLIQLVYQSTGYTFIESGNFGIYDSFLLVDRARTHHEQGDNAMGAEMRIYREAYPKLGRRPMLGLDEAFSTMSPEDQVLFLTGLGMWVRERNGKIFIATHSELFTEAIEKLDGFKVYHYLTTFEANGRPKYHYVLTEGPAGSNAVALADTMGVIPAIAARARLAAKGELHWEGVKTLPATVELPTEPSEETSWTRQREDKSKSGLFFQPASGAPILTVFTLDSSLNANPLFDRYDQYIRENFAWDALTGKGSYKTICRHLLHASMPDPELRSARRRLLEAAVSRWDPEVVRKSSAEIANLISMREAIPDQVSMLRDFNRRINPFHGSDKQRTQIESLRLACQYVALTKKLCGDTFEESKWVEEGPALEDALLRYEAARDKMSLRDISVRINAKRDVLLSPEELAQVKELLETCNDAALIPAIKTVGHASDYVDTVMNRGSVEDILAQFVLALESRAKDPEQSANEAKSREEARKAADQKREKYRAWFFKSLNGPVHLKSTPRAWDFEALRAIAPDSAFGGKKFEDISLKDLSAWLTKQYETRKGIKDREIVRPIGNMLSVGAEFMHYSLLASEIGLSGPYAWQKPEQSFASASARVRDITSTANTYDFDDKLPAANLFKFDAPSLASDILPFLPEKEAYSPTTALFFARVAIDWSLRQLVDPKRAPPNIGEELRKFKIPELEPLIGEIESIVQTLGVPNGGADRRDLMTGEKIERDHVKFWRRYNRIVKLFMTPEAFTAGETASAANDAAAVKTALDSMRTTSNSQIVRGYGELYEAKYGKRMDELDEIKKKLEALSKGTVWEDPRTNTLVAQLILGNTPPNDRGLSLAQAFAKDTKAPDGELEAIKSLSDVAEKRRRFKAYCTTVLAEHESGKAAVKFLEAAKPLFDQVRLIAEKRKVIEPKDSLLLPEEVSERLRKRYVDEAQKLFAFSKTRLDRVHALLTEVQTIGALASALREKKLCFVDRNTEGRIDIVGLRPTERETQDQIVAQDYHFTPKTAGELLNSPNRSGKTMRSKLLAKGVTHALAFDLAPAESVSLPEDLAGVLYVDRVTTKTASGFGSAGNEFLVWSKVDPVIHRGKYLTIVDEAFATMTPSDQSNFIPAMGVTVLETGGYLEFSCHNGTALKKFVATGAPAVPRMMGYLKDPTTGNLSFTYKVYDGYAPSEAVTMALQMHYPWEFLEGVVSADRKPPEPDPKVRRRGDWENFNFSAPVQ